MWASALCQIILCGILVQSSGARSILQGNAGPSGGAMPLVQGSGSTAAAVVWRSIIANASSTGNAPFSLTYDAVGSGQGLKNLMSRAYDYAISDVPISLDVYSSLDRRGGMPLLGPILQVPFALSAFDAIHSVQGLSAPLRLNAYTLGGILQCTITRWDDPAIKALNPASQMPSVDINPVVREDSSGSTQLLTKYLATDPGWTLGVAKTIVWPKCAQQVQGSDAAIAYIASTPNAIGYAEYGLALTQNLGLAALQNRAGNFVSPSDVFLRNITEVFGSDLAIPSSTLSPGWANVTLASSLPLAYPVTGMEFFFVDANLSARGYQQALILKELAQYMLSDAVQLNLPFWTFAALPEKIRVLAQRDTANIPVPPRPANADQELLPDTWINVYDEVSISEVQATNRV